jgi:Zn-dependent M28 family amino/carboxypeptidase
MPARRFALAALAIVLLPLAAWAGTLQKGAGPISPGRLAGVVKTLASDSFAGRAPAGPGEQQTIDFLVKRFKALGLQPAGPGGSWTQEVPLLKTQVEPESTAAFVEGGAEVPLVIGQDIYLSTVQPKDEIKVDDLPLVFVGYGVSAPERGWDDFKGVDLKGKIAVFLVNDPDFEAVAGDAVAGRFGGKAMTYYGRWTYKYEEAARRGAAGALIVHETPGAGYGWVTVAAPRGEMFDVVRDDGGAGRVPFQGWIQRDSAVALFKAAGLSLDALKVQARSAAFKPVTLEGVRFRAELKVTQAQVVSHNILAKLPGAKRPDESVMFSAHWDAYGIAATPDASGQTIRRGAADDGIGVAGLLELARAFAKGPRPDRSLVFGVWTAEERGLLGSEYWAQHPTVSLARIAGSYTMDVLQTAGPARDVVLVGAGQNDLEQGLAAAAGRQGRSVTPDAKPERGLFYRADHFSLAKRGVPVLLLMGIGGGADLVKGGRKAGDQWVSDYTASCYHQTCDSFSSRWDLRGAAQDVELLYVAGGALANSRVWPEWHTGSEFAGVRAQSSGERR